MKTVCIEFTPNELPEHSRKILDNGYMREDYRSHWIDIWALLDGIHEERFAGVEYPKGRFKNPTLAHVPKAWWKLMAFPPKMERAMKVFWKKNPGGSIYWRW